MIAAILLAKSKDGHSEANVLNTAMKQRVEVIKISKKVKN